MKGVATKPPLCDMCEKNLPCCNPAAPCALKRMWFESGEAAFAQSLLEFAKDLGGGIEAIRNEIERTNALPTAYAVMCKELLERCERRLLGLPTYCGNCGEPMPCSGTDPTAPDNCTRVPTKD